MLVVLEHRRLPLIVIALILALVLVACQRDAEEAQPVGTGAAATLEPTVTEPSSELAVAEPSPEPTVTEPPPEPTATGETTASPTPESASPEEPTPATPTPAPTAEPAEGPATAISLALVTGGLTRPVYLTHAFDDRQFVVEQAGTIRLLRDDQIESEPFLDIVDRVNSTALEQGLLSVAFHPEYALNGRFFVNYTDLNGDTVIAEYAASVDDPDRGDPDSERILLNVSQPFGNHNGGQLKFGPDGYLYVGMGDGGGAGDSLNNGQNPDTLLGAVLRLDVNGNAAGADPYAVPADNPFVGQAGAREEIWATGLRNPWRFSFDRQSGDLYIADVGQNIWEEVNFQPAGDPGGANYGWKVLEASHCYQSDSCDPAGFVSPVAEYAHQGGHCSITGGYVYRGQQYPELGGNYFFADYCSGTIWGLFRLPDGSWQQTALLDTDFLISSFGEDDRGELYVLDHGNGDVYRLGR